MATIYVDSLDAPSAPSPLLLAYWTREWSPHLAALTPWAPSSPGSQLSFRCTTTSDVFQTQAVVDVDLTAWVNEYLGHRTYDVAQDGASRLEIRTG